MSPIYTPGKLVLRHQLPADTDADNYIAAVEAADGQALEPGVKFAIKNFVLCCKADGIWSAIKASCILAGARTLNGALVPLVGTAPTNNNFVSGDYNRKKGLVGNGSTKYLDSNREAGADPLNNYHCAAFPTQAATVGGFPRLLECQLFTEAGSTGIAESLANGYAAYSRFSAANNSLLKVLSAVVGVSRSSSSSYNFRRNNDQVTVTQGATNLLNLERTWKVFTNATNQSERSNARLAFYSIGESLDLALLDARVTDLINAFGAAIP